jgi:hypothetical protein
VPVKTAMSFEDVILGIWIEFNFQNNPKQLWEDATDSEEELELISEITEEVANQDDDTD